MRLVAQRISGAAFNILIMIANPGPKAGLKTPRICNNEALTDGSASLSNFGKRTLGICITAWLDLSLVRSHFVPSRILYESSVRWSVITLTLRRLACKVVDMPRLLLQEPRSE